MKEIIGDDHPTYEESVNMSLAEQASVRMEEMAQLREEEKDVTKSNLDRLLKENFELKHRLSCIADDIEIIDRHIQNNCNKRFKRPSRNKDGSVFAEQAWHNITNVQIACDLNDDEPLEWGSKVMAEEYRHRQQHIKHMEAEADFLNKYKAKK